MTTDIADSLLNVARQMAVEGNLSPALKLLEQDEGDDSRALLLKAKILSQLGRFGEATEVWQTVLDADPQCAEARSGIARARAAATPVIGVFRRYSLPYLLSCGLTLLFIVSLACASVAYAVTQLGNQESVPDSAKQPTEALASGTGEQLESLQLRLDRLESMVADLPQPAPPPPSRTEVSREDLQRLQTKLEQQGERIASLTAEIKDGLSQSKSYATEVEEKVASQSEALRTELASRMLESQKQTDSIRESQLVWRVDELVQRSRNLRTNDPRRLQVLNTIRTLLNELDKMEIDPRNANYLAATRQWVNKQSPSR